MTHPRSLKLCFVILALVSGRAADAQDGPPSSGPELVCEITGEQSSGARFEICMPPLWRWNGDLVVFAHGYVPATVPLQDPGLLVVGERLVNLFGYAFATTSYSVNGLAVVEGIHDVVDLVDVFAAHYRAPVKIYLVGYSEGALISTLVIEQYPEIFDGALAMCGPIGDFEEQITYIGDFRVVFDYFFPGLLPPSPVEIPQQLIDDWASHYRMTIKPVVEDPLHDPDVEQLMAVTGAAHSPADRATREQTILGVLSYNVLGTNDAVAKLGGQPFSNRERLYVGSVDDQSLNQRVFRVAPDQAALGELSLRYRTSGQLTRPLVAIHTTRDPIVPYRQMELYRAKVDRAETSGLFRATGVERYGHCNFTPLEILGAFFQMSQMANPGSPDGGE